MKKSSLVITLLIVAAIAGVIVYNLPYFKEMRAYNEAVKINEFYAYNDYLSKYPDGRHAENVMMHRFDLSYSTLDRLNYAQEYIEAFPDGVFADLVNARIDSIWDEEIFRYKNRSSDRGDKQATAYMLEMLEYMKHNRINTLIVDVEPTIDLKDYNEFDERVRLILELLDDSGLSFDTDMISLKSNFSQGAVDNLTDILIGGVQQSFASIFTEGIINVEPKDYSSLSVQTPNITFYYTIANQIDQVGEYDFPHIWTYSSNNVAKKLLLGIDVAFNAKFSIPGSDQTYSFQEKGEPGNEISDIDDIRDGYRRMTKACFNKFSDKITSIIGLD